MTNDSSSLESVSRWFARLDDFERNLGSDGQDFWIGIRHGSMRAELFAPVGEDRQQPHEQDELYIVFRGSARFQREGEVIDVGPGDMMFVEAGRRHGFADLSDDFATWVVFWGPLGGEGPV